MRQTQWQALLLGVIQLLLLSCLRLLFVQVCLSNPFWGSPKKVENGFDVEVMRKPDWILCAKIPSQFPVGHDNHGIKSMHDFTFSLYSALTGNWKKSNFADLTAWGLFFNFHLNLLYYSFLFEIQLLTWTHFRWDLVIYFWRIWHAAKVASMRILPYNKVSTLFML